MIELLGTASASSRETEITVVKPSVNDRARPHVTETLPQPGRAVIESLLLHLGPLRLTAIPITVLSGLLPLVPLGAGFPPSPRHRPVRPIPALNLQHFHEATITG